MNYIGLLIISLAISSISYTISKSRIFRSLRKFVSKNSDWLGELFSCPYCLSHWVSFIIILYLYRTINFEMILLTFGMVAASAIWIGMIARSFDFLPQDD